jgi:hypothetical protein
MGYARASRQAKPRLCRDGACPVATGPIVLLPRQNVPLPMGSLPASPGSPLWPTQDSRAAVARSSRAAGKKFGARRDPPARAWTIFREPKGSSDLCQHRPHAVHISIELEIR